MDWIYFWTRRNVKKFEHAPPEVVSQQQDPMTSQVLHQLLMQTNALAQQCGTIGNDVSFEYFIYISVEIIRQGFRFGHPLLIQ